MHGQAFKGMVEWGGVGEGGGKDEPEEHFASMSERVKKKKEFQFLRRSPLTESVFFL